MKQLPKDLSGFTIAQKSVEFGLLLVWFVKAKTYFFWVVKRFFLGLNTFFPLQLAIS